MKEPYGCMRPSCNEPQGLSKGRKELIKGCWEIRIEIFLYLSKLN